MMTSTGTICERMSEFGCSIADDEVDNRPAPAKEELQAMVRIMMEAVDDWTEDTCLAADAAQLQWGIVSAINYQITRLENLIDQNSQRRKGLSDHFDGSTTTADEIDHLEKVGENLVERQEALEDLLRVARDALSSIAGLTWQPPKGTSAPWLSASVIASNDFARARKLKWHRDHYPDGPRFLVTGNRSFDNAAGMFKVLDRCREKYPDMVLFHGANVFGADALAVQWAAKNDVPSVPCPPEWQKYGKTKAGWKRNEEWIALKLQGVFLFGKESGLHQKLKELATKADVGVWDLDERVTGRKTDDAGKTKNQPTAQSATPENVINQLGPNAVASHFGITEKTVIRWLKKSVPPNRAEAVLNLLN